MRKRRNCIPKHDSLTHERFLIRVADTTLDAPPDELTVLLAIAERLRMGREMYGRLDLVTNTRDWVKEMREELLDAIVYGTFASVAAERGDDRKTDPAPALAAGTCSAHDATGDEA